MYGGDCTYILILFIIYFLIYYAVIIWFVWTVADTFLNRGILSEIKRETPFITNVSVRRVFIFFNVAPFG